MLYHYILLFMLSFISCINYVFFFMYYMSMLGDTNSMPYDLPETESELVAGFITEYSSMYFSLIMLTEYANMIILCYFIMFIFTLYAFILLQLLVLVSLIRSTLNSLKFDELMTNGWIVLLPIMFSFLLMSLID